MQVLLQLLLMLATPKLPSKDAVTDLLSVGRGRGDSHLGYRGRGGGDLCCRGSAPILAWPAVGDPIPQGRILALSGHIGRAPAGQVRGRSQHHDPVPAPVPAVRAFLHPLRDGGHRGTHASPNEAASSPSPPRAAGVVVAAAGSRPQSGAVVDFPLGLEGVEGLHGLTKVDAEPGEGGRMVEPVMRLGD